MDYLAGFGIKLPLLFLLALNTTSATILIITIISLTFLSFLIAGSEVAFFSLNSKDINILKTKKRPSYRRIINLLEQPKILLAALQISNSFFTIGIILISNLLLNNWLGNYEIAVWSSFLIKVIIVSFFLLLFAKVLPKIWAANHKIWFASNASAVIELLNNLFYRLSKKLVRISDSIEKRVSFSKSTDLDNSNLDYAIDLLPDTEATIEEKHILKGIRKFGSTSVKQVMRTRLDVSGIEFEFDLTKVIKLAEDLHYSRLPVYKSNLDNIIGVLHIKDLLPYLEKTDTSDWHSLIRPPYFVHEQKLIEDLLQEFRAKRIHFAIVVDEFGGTEGIVTLEDVIEEIVGEIKDEFDEEESINKKIDDNNYIFEGKIMINDFCASLNKNKNTFDSIRGASDSLAGLVLEIAGEFPQINEQFSFGEFTFIPLEINKNKIDKIKVIIHNNESSQ